MVHWWLVLNSHYSEMIENPIYFSILCTVFVYAYMELCQVPCMGFDFDSDFEKKCAIITQGNKHRQISPRGLLPSGTAGWHSPHDLKWPTPTTQQQKVHTQDMSIKNTNMNSIQILKLHMDRNTVCVCLVIPVCSVDRRCSLCTSHSSRGNLSPPQTKSQWRRKMRWHHKQKDLCSSQCDWKMRSVEGGGLSGTMLPSPLQARPTSHPTPIRQ